MGPPGVDFSKYKASKLSQSFVQRKSHPVQLIEYHLSTSWLSDNENRMSGLMAHKCLDYVCFSGMDSTEAHEELLEFIDSSLGKL